MYELARAAVGELHLCSTAAGGRSGRSGEPGSRQRRRRGGPERSCTIFAARR
jgi:hypothetical protein